MMLERRGYRVTTANSADEAVERAEEENFDLMISDIGLPDRSGYELMQELRSTKSMRGIALSGFGMENDVSRARAAGFSEHLTKPINFERLEEAIHNLLDLDPACLAKRAAAKPTAARIGRERRRPQFRRSTTTPALRAVASGAVVPSPRSEASFISRESFSTR